MAGCVSEDTSVILIFNDKLLIIPRVLHDGLSISHVLL